MKKVLSISLVLILLFAVFSCSDEPISLGDVTTINSSYKVGDELKIPTETSANVPVTYTVTFTDADGKASILDVVDNKIKLERGTYKIEFKSSNGLVINNEFKVTDAAFDSVFKGFGTEARPYEIADAKGFLELNDMEVRSNNKQYFKLTGNIDLRDISSENKYAVKAFNGILDGENHTIIGNDNIQFIFYYLFADSTIRNLKIDFDTDSVTGLWYLTAINGEIASGTTLNNYKVSYDKPTIDIKLENVDFVPSSSAIYFIGDDNAALYQYNTVSYGAVLSKDVYNGFWISQNVSFGETPVKYTITLTDCDVEGNYKGGFGGSGAAIFFGGQLWGVDVVLNNCSFKGNLEGYNVAMLLGNGANCEDSTIYLTDVNNNGTISSYTNAGSLLYGNRAKSDAIVHGEITGESIKQVTPFLELISPEKNSSFDFSSLAEGEYELKLFLPSVYTYYENEFEYQTNSNTITIPITKETADFYLAKVISSDDEKAKTLNLIDWSSINTSTKEGAKYQFVSEDADKYIVIFNDSEVKKYYTKNDKGISVEPSYIKKALLLKYNSVGNIEDASKLISLSAK